MKISLVPLFACGIVMTLSPGVLAEATSDPLSVGQGSYQASWDSLESQYQVPEWFRDAKFGIWAHWTAQSQPEQGDWYARRMYIQGERDYDYQREHYGHPSKAGFKDIDHLWHAEHWDPEKLMSLYKAAGARYFVALANHHDNFDCWNSKYQAWNSVNIGPHKDIVGLWEKAARAEGLRFGVSVHAARAWNWFEVAQGSDTNGPLKGLPYDGTLTKADGMGTWWDGYDPQELYAQNHPPGAPPDEAYCRKFGLRTLQLIDDYKPDLLYFDDSVLPLRKVDKKYGLSIAAHYYNASARWHGTNEAVMTCKHLGEDQRRALVWDIERGKTEAIDPVPWQTDTCIGNWHYNRSIFERHRYKTAAQVVPMLVDIVSKNGNLLLSIPLRGDGTIDSDELEFLRQMADWIKVNGECIYSTRPWKICGEGPALNVHETNRFGGVKDVSKQALTAADIRFTTKGDSLYAIALGWPEDGALRIKSLGAKAGLLDRNIARISLLGDRRTEIVEHGAEALNQPVQPSALHWIRSADELTVDLPKERPGNYAWALKITLE